MSDKCFEGVKGKLGFGCMRLPLVGEEVDLVETAKMFDAFLDAGFNYFDTAHGYIKGKSETAIKACLASRYPRDRYILANKLTPYQFKTNEDIRPLFQSQLDACGVEYFDYYLMHTQNRHHFEKFKECRAYEEAFLLKKEGKVKHVGFSFHDTAEVLERILIEYPEIEFVQIQFNYADYNDPSVQSKRCYEVCRKYNKPIIVMEPVKGGTLVNLPDKAKEIFSSLSDASYASYAIRFAASFEGVEMVLSGMGNMDMTRDNISYMKEFTPLSEKEFSAVMQVCDVFREYTKNLVPCTACRYCVEKCPQNIKIPELFACLNSSRQFNEWSSKFYYEDIYTKSGTRASDCIKCGLCESVCPQNLEIRKLLTEVADAFEKKDETK